MKVFYFNDRKTPVTIFVGTLTNKHAVLQPATGTEVVVPLSVDEIVFVKSWEAYVLITNMLQLSEKDSELFQNALNNPPEPNEVLKETMKVFDETR